MPDTSFHPAELAYALSYANVRAVLGWGADPFTPPRGRSDAFYEDGLARLQRAKRLVPGKQKGRFRFSAEMSRAIGVLSDPQIVFVAHRKEGKGAQVLTHHVAGESVIEMSLGKTGEFEMREQPSLAAAAGAAAAFAGTAMQPASTHARLQMPETDLERIKKLAGKSAASAAGALKDLGMEESAAKSAATAFGKPQAAGVINIMYCTGNTAKDADSYAVLTDANQNSWVMIQAGPLAIIEQTSVGALTAKMLVDVAERTLE